MHALTNWVAREMNLPPDQAQAAAWTTFRTLWTDKTIGPELRNNRIGLSDAIRQGKAAGLPIRRQWRDGRSGGSRWSAQRCANVLVEQDQRCTRPHSSERLVQHAAAGGCDGAQRYCALSPVDPVCREQRAVLDPSGFQYGTVSGPKTGIRRAVGNEPAAALRDLALADQPVIRVPGEFQVDPTTGKIPWLAVEHVGGSRIPRGTRTSPWPALRRRRGAPDRSAARSGSVQPRRPHVHERRRDLRRGTLSASRGRAGAAEPMRWLRVDWRSSRETAGNGLRVPLLEGKIAGLGRQVQNVLSEEALSVGTLLPYTGDTHAVEPARQGRARGAGNQGGGYPPDHWVYKQGTRVRQQQLAQTLFRDAAPGGAATESGAGPPSLPHRARASRRPRKWFRPRADRDRAVGRASGRCRGGRLRR